MFRRGSSIRSSAETDAEAEELGGGAAPSPRGRHAPREMAGNVLIGITVAASLVGAVLIGTPALEPERQQEHDGRPAASEPR